MSVLVWLVVAMLSLATQPLLGEEQNGAAPPTQTT
jgi:hypothetical protein